jgi:hypothetical protein
MVGLMALQPSQFAFYQFPIQSSLTCINQTKMPIATLSLPTFICEQNGLTTTDMYSSNLTQDMILYCFPQPLQAIPRIVPWTGHDHILSSSSFVCCRTIWHTTESGYWQCYNLPCKKMGWGITTMGNFGGYRSAELLPVPSVWHKIPVP